jgi:hypothetical protein
MATSDSAYNANGIADYAALKAKYCDTDTPANATDSLHLYVGYHILEGLRFIADLNSSSSYSTLTTDQVITITVSSDSVLINQQTVNGVLEEGVLVQRSKSDNSSKNGVWHVLEDDYYIKVREVTRVFFDLADYDDIRSKVTGWGTAATASASTKFSNGDVDGISIYSKSSATAILYYNWVTTSTTSASTFFVNYNYLTVNMRSAAAVGWIKFTTPFIAAGEYKVWMAYRVSGKTNPCSIMIDSTNMSDVNFYSSLPSRGSKALAAYDNYLQGLGYKRPVQIKGMVNYTVNKLVGIYLGKITLSTSSTHWVKITATTTGNNSSSAYLDYIEFIPTDDDQIWPKYDQDGTAWPRPDNDDYDDTSTAIY